MSGPTIGVGSRRRLAIASCVVLLAAGPSLATMDPGQRAAPRYQQWQPQDLYPATRGQVQAFLTRVNQAMAKGDRPAALAALLELEKMVPANSVLANDVGVLHGMMGNMTEAVTAFRRAVRLDKRNVLAVGNLSQSLMDLKRLAEAHEFLDSWRSKIPQFPSIGIAIARLAIMEDRRIEAVETIRAVAASPKVDVDSLFECANLFKALGQVPAAEDLFRKLTRESPELAGPWLSLANLLAVTGRFADAKTVVEEALGRFPDQPQLLSERGLLFERLGQLEEAVSNFDRAYSMSPLLGQAALQAALCLAKMGRKKDALSRLAPLLAPGGKTLPRDRETARLLQQEIAGGGARAKQQRSPAAHLELVRRALRETRDFRPDLSQVVWKDVVAGDNGKPTLQYVVNGEGDAPDASIAIRVWQTREPLDAKARPAGVTAVSEATSGLAAGMKQTLTKRYPGVAFQVGGIAGSGHAGTLVIFGRLQPDLWVEYVLRGSAALKAAGVLDLGDSLAKAVKEGPNAGLKELDRIVGTGVLRGATASLQVQVQSNGQVATFSVEPRMASAEVPAEFTAVPVGRPKFRTVGPSTERQDFLWLGKVPCIVTRLEPTAAPTKLLQATITALVGPHLVTIESHNDQAIKTLGPRLVALMSQMYPVKVQDPK